MGEGGASKESQGYVKTRFGERLFIAFEEFSSVLSEVLGVAPSALFEPETKVDDVILSTQKLSLVTLYEIKGINRVLSSSDFSEVVDNLSSKLAPYLSKNGSHYIQFVMSYDPNSSEKMVNDSLEPIKHTSNKLGFDMDFIFDDWGRTMKNWVSEEKVYLAVWTRMSKLTKHNAKVGMREQAKRSSETTYSKNAQNVSAYVPILVNEHRSLVEGVGVGLDSSGLIYETLNCHEAVRVMRTEIDPEATPKRWKPYLKGDKIMPRTKHRLEHPEALDNVLYPRIVEQVFPREPEDINDSMVMIGENLHHPLVLKVPPQEIKSFNSLFGVLNKKSFPWRLSFGIDGHAPNFGLKKSLASALVKTSTDNKAIVSAIKYIEQLMGHPTEHVVEFKASFNTWVKAYEADAELKLKAQASELISAVQSWGNAEVSDVIGHPTLGFMSTVPGAMDSTPSAGAGARLKDVIKLMPIIRPASLWTSGSSMFRTSCGKPFHYQQGSKYQASWIDLSIAPMGFGKSVQLNTMNWTFMVEAGANRMGWVSMIDIGPSSKGMVNLLKAGLPKDQQHLAVYHRLKLDPSNSINPCDTMLGVRKPTINQKMFLVNLLCLFTTPLNEEAPKDGMEDIALRSIELAYDEFSDKYNPKEYVRGVYEDVDNMLHKLDFDFSVDDVSWWEVVDFLFEKDQVFLASKAQRMAVPLLTEIAAMAKHSTITNIYHEDDGALSQEFWRAIIKSVKAYPILKEPTRLDFSESRVISLDLDEVAPKGGGAAERQTAVMYMLARHILLSRFFVDYPDIPNDTTPKLRGFLSERIKSLQEDPKRFNCDEFHRVTRGRSSGSAVRQFVSDVDAVSRESRKWKIYIGLASQEVDDIPSSIRNLATSIYFLGAGSNEELSKVKDYFGLSLAETKIIKGISRPGPQGSTFFAYFRTSKGDIKQKLMNTVGSVMLWGFSSTKDDNTVREALVDRIGLKNALIMLSKVYPGGSVENEIEKRKELYSRDMDKNVDITHEIYEELVDIYHRNVVSPSDFK